VLLELPAMNGQEEGKSPTRNCCRVAYRARVDEHSGGQGAQWGPDLMRLRQKHPAATLDHLWREHLIILDHLRVR